MRTACTQQRQFTLADNVFNSHDLSDTEQCINITWRNLILITHEVKGLNWIHWIGGVNVVRISI